MIRKGILLKKYVKIMRMMFFLLLAGINLCNAANIYSQSKMISLSIRNVSVKEIFDQIEKNSEFLFFYKNADIDLNRKVSIQARNQTIHKVLDQLFEGTDNTYLISDRQVFISKKKASGIPVPNEINQSGIVITGTIEDHLNEPLPGVNIVIKGTQTGIVSDYDGTFSITVPDERAVLVFSFIGYTPQEVAIGSKRKLNVKLRELSHEVDEVVVVGYSKQSKMTLTGSISAIKQEEIQAIATPTLGEGLLGKTAGISMTQSSGTPGESDPSVYIRGIGTFNATEPLFIIDGVPNSKRAFMQLSPASIKDISILKDASATAVYGVKGANGVIIVSTRRGSAGKISIDTQFSYGIQQSRQLLEFADSYQYALAYNQMLLSDGKTTGFISDDHSEHYRKNDEPLLYPNKNWVDEVVNNLAPLMRANLNISGGTESIQYFTSVSYLSEEGMLKQYGPAMADFGYDRLNLQTNVDINITPTTKLSFTGSSRIGDRTQPLPVNTVTMDVLWGRLYNIPPMTSYGVYEGKFVNPDMRYLPEPIAFIEESFPQYLYRGDYRKAEENRFDFNFDFTQEMKGIWRELNGLKFRTKMGYRSGFDRNKVIQGGLNSVYTAIYNKDAVTPNPNLPGDQVVLKKTGEETTKSWGTSYSPSRYLYFEAGFDYEKTFGSHFLSGLILYNQNKDFFPPSTWVYSNIPIGNVGLVGRINYNYNQKYMAEVNVGYNGSENFAKNKRFGWFPSFSAGWVASKEKFMGNIDFIDQLKFRFSYGIVGSDQAGGESRFTYIGTSYDRDISQYYGYNFGDDISQFRPGVLESSVGNTKVTWETAKKQNYGVDLELFDNRFFSSFDYFHEYRDDILMAPKSTPGFVGFTMPMLNIGEVKNKGFDIVAGWRGRIKDFNYSFDGNLTYSKNVILFMDEIPPVEPYQTVTGHHLNYYYGYVWDGYYTEEEVNIINEERASGVSAEDRSIPLPTAAFVKAGDMKYADLNNDGTVDQIDRKVIGNPRDPQIMFGFNGRFSWKNFDFSFGLQGVSRISRELGYKQPFGSNGRNSLWLPFYENSWTPERAETGTVEWPRISVDNKSYNAETSTFWIRDASYLRLKRAELGYTFNKIPVIKQLRLYLSGTNLFTLQKNEFRWSDPELYNQTYPLVKLYSIGLDVSF
ncbi:MAG: TonB-dependent receptor [Prevotella sp.]|jgi:TonB-linked SusC/RagA family outer membrane protein|nr:TonB-dependent receptor [Prevotella sp.]